ncbi:hypothetical protein DM02DRAFT_388397 [Periconia macrospinosa]|uniref:Uncharacterized protein n=1 Tax=Periconia macrospinosa TaxID=97972 RepID=A0A2V1DTJ5_9PLEO|nr:hypothetical protein DM02DRAFT_388397 [Periconia macrospinosa]
MGGGYTISFVVVFFFFVCKAWRFIFSFFFLFGLSFLFPPVSKHIQTHVYCTDGWISVIYIYIPGLGGV